ncbi:SurA domain protein (fragment) [Candidatus Filomicrobium marinum]|uniref:SurA domain protein n=2 Tax=Filomicrobium TaxID=119044 RepID=A0A0D6JID7_9HYPH
MPRSRLFCPRLVRSALCSVIALGSWAALTSTVSADPAALARASGAMAKAHGAALVHVTASRTQGIAVLVNDEPITNYEIELRQKLLAMNVGGLQERAQANFKKLVKAESTNTKLKAILDTTIKANQGKSREEILAIFEQKKKDFAKGLQEQAVSSARASVLPGLRKKALEELIEERLKLQEAKRLNVLAEDDEVNKIIAGLAERNKMNEKQFEAHMKKMGTDVYTMRTRFQAMMSWQNVVRRQFGHQIAITDRDLDRAVSQVQAEDQTELNLQRIVLIVPDKVDQAVVARRLREASALRQNFKGCSMTGTLAKSEGATRFDNIGPRAASTIAEPTRTLLLNASDGEMLPATVGSEGIELWVLCGRKVVEAKETQRDEAVKELRQQEFNVLAERHLKDLRQDAHIEYR